MKKFIAVKENSSKTTHLKIEVYYNLGGYNCFTHKTDARGYYLSVSPVTRYDRDGVQFESYTAFSGVKMCLLEVSRKSKKAEENAHKLAEQNENDLIAYICGRHGLEVCASE